MKTKFQKCFGLIGLVVYYILLTVVKLPVGLFLWLAMGVILILVGPFRHHEPTVHWLNRLYDWYVN